MVGIMVGMEEHKKPSTLATSTLTNLVSSDLTYQRKLHVTP
jgi:hypothetical protein